MEEYENYVFKLKTFLGMFFILVHPKEGAYLYLYLSIIDNIMIFVLVQELNEIERPFYIVSKVFKGFKLRYQKIERLMLTIVAGMGGKTSLTL